MRQRITLGATGTAACVLAWQLASAVGLLSPGLIPTPVAVARRLGSLVTDPTVHAASAVTAVTWLLAMLVTVAIAVPTGLLLGAVPVLRAATGVVIDLVRPIPAVALLPLSTVLLGSGPPMTIVLAVFAGIWPILFNLLYGLSSIEPTLLDTARSVGLRPWRVAARVRLPALLPSLLIGVRLASAIELVVVVSLDFLTGDGSGLGAYLYNAGEQAGDLTTVLAGVIVVGALGMLIDLGVTSLRRRWFDHIGGAGRTGDASPGGRSRFAWGWLAVGVGLVAWQVAATAARSPFLSSPSQITGPLVRLWQHPGSTILPSTSRIAAGWSIAVVAGIAGGVVLGLVPLLGASLEPVLAFIRSTPPVLCLPIAFAFLRIGAPLEIATIAAGSVWPILLGTADGVRRVHPTVVDISRAYRTSRWRHIVFVLVPAAAPQILAGLRISLSLALILMVVSELVGADSGLGFALTEAQSQFDYPTMWAAVVTIGVIGYAGNRGFVALEHRLLPTTSLSL